MRVYTYRLPGVERDVDGQVEAAAARQVRQVLEAGPALQHDDGQRQAQRPDRRGGECCPTVFIENSE